MRTVPVVTALLLACATPPAAAQQADPSLSFPRQPVGWSFTPRLATGAAWDDNVLIAGGSDALAADLNTAVEPGASLDFIGKRSSFSASYRGSAQMYRDFNALNNYAQRLNVSARRRLSAKTILFGQQSYSAMPTTELPAFVGIPFRRIGARIADFRGGVESMPTKRVSFSLSYNFQWIDFNKDPVLGVALLGGHANGGTAGLRYHVTAHTSLTTDYNVQRASIVTGGRFTLQTGWAGLEHQFSETARAYGSLGVARVDAVDAGSSKTAPAWRAGFSQRIESAVLDIIYGRSFVPSYGGGGTLSNQELTGHLRIPIARRAYTEGVVSWRSNQPLAAAFQSLTSVWVGATVGYVLQPWARVEAFYGSTHQSIDRPGGQLDRHRVGIQVITAKPMRIR